MTIEKINDNYMDTQGNIYVDARTDDGKNVEILLIPGDKLIGATITPLSPIERDDTFGAEKLETTYIIEEYNL